MLRLHDASARLREDSLLDAGRPGTDLGTVGMLDARERASPSSDLVLRAVALQFLLNLCLVELLVRLTFEM